jgi:hypothetical protein
MKAKDLDKIFDDGEVDINRRQKGSGREIMISYKTK